MLEKNPKWEPRRGHFLVIWLLFSVPDGLVSPNGSQASPESPQDQSKPRFPSIFGWCWTIRWWFSVSCGLLCIWFTSLLFWLPRAFIFKFLATSSNVLGSSAGVTKVTKNAIWPTFCLACLFVFVTSSPTFQVSGHRFFGVVSRVISESRSTARWRECRRQLR